MTETLETYFKNNFSDRKIILCRDLSKNPADYYLKVVLAHYRGEYVTWLFNITLNGGNGGFIEGKYFGDDFASASESYYRRS